jgi:aminopeptidase N
MFTSKTIYTVRIVYTGIINKELSGLYLNYYVDMNGNKSMFMTSGMEPMNARSMLPCIDEPARKAIFQISVVHDPSYTPWSNGEIQRIESLNDGRLLSHFSPTLPMSTYLLALILAPKSDFSCLPDHVIGSKNTKSRVCGRVQILPQLTYADDIASKTLEFFNTYFNIDYPLPKIEHFDVINFPGEAMENYGRNSLESIQKMKMFI